VGIAAAPPGRFNDDLCTQRGRKIAVPACFVAGASDWGRKRPGDLARMRSQAFADDRGCHFIGGAGHWVQQEQPQAVVRHLLDFLKNLHGRG
jgi:pimeloyl-ACP methyl ester carboxylesterase